MAVNADRRLLLVHAHPDDEAIATGATMAKYAAEGAHVTLITCTLGEEGEIVVPDLAHLAVDHQDELGQHRADELAAAMKALGVTDHRFLGGPGRWRDSGMMGEPSNDRPDSFWQADMDEATRELVAVVREVRPQVIVTYDENGAYGHPDHIRAHDVAMGAFRKSADPSFAPGTGAPWQPAKLYYSVVPKSVIQAAMDHLGAKGQDLFDGAQSADDIPFAMPDEQVTTEVDASAYIEAKRDSLRAHRSQISENDPFFSLFDDVGLGLSFGVEHYFLAEGPRGPGQGPYSWETDLFAATDAR
ncbi:MAG: N-acetyl-1-D-myo-inositol-2-amino-2-deoxy-alpha-D-glucopyranoside deacetylase [Actinomycetes bacterium]